MRDRLQLGRRPTTKVERPYATGLERFVSMRNLVHMKLRVAANHESRRHLIASFPPRSIC